MRIYFDDPMVDAPAYVDDLAPLPAPATRPARQPVRNRNWQVAVVYAMIHTGLMTVIITQGSGDGRLGLLSLAFHGAVFFFAMCAGFVFGRL